MISFKCKNCGGEMSVDRQGNLLCEYCGSKSVFKDLDLAEYKNYRLQVLNYLREIQDQRSSDTHKYDSLWNNAEAVRYKTSDNVDITINYIYTYQNEFATMYLAKQSVIYVFPKEYAHKAQAMDFWLSKVTFPAADMKGLERCFPANLNRFNLQDGAVLLSFSRRENFFPLAMFGALPAVHAAWIVSRMENICCVLEYSGLTHGDISTETIFINPITHEAMLCGGWWNAGKQVELMFKPVNEDLVGIRKTAERSMGVSPSDVPKEFARFLKEKPKTDAYADFERWDDVIEKGFGGRRFVKMNGNNDII